MRWQVEVDLRDLKMTLGMDVLKGKKVQTVQKEVLVYVLVTAARRQRTRPRRISFIDAVTDRLAGALAAAAQGIAASC